jgi:antagonist of KipI
MVMNPSQSISNNDSPGKINVFSVQKPGLMTTVQDGGRFHYQWMGMPISGTLDQYAYRVGNILLRQDENHACLEITYMGPQLKVLSNTQIAVTGADVAPKRNGKPFPMWTAIGLHAGDDLTLGSACSGCRACLCVKGGIDVPQIMGSRSTNLRLKIGGFQGRILRSGDQLYSSPCEEGIEKADCRSLPNDFIPNYPPSVVVRVISGPQKNYFDKKEGIRTFFGSTYKVSAEANREGFRLDGPSVEIKKGMKKSIPSEACPPGGIQIRPNGKPIILLNDLGGGGYAKIATILSSELPTVAQLKPGDQIVFKEVSLTEAHRVLREEENKINLLKKLLGFPR